MAIDFSRGLYGKLVEELGSTIASGRIASGQRLDVDGLEQRHGVSRTVVREAIRVLTTKGLVDARPKRGTFVLERQHWNLLDPDVVRWHIGATPDIQFLDKLNEVRQIVEPASARLAATRRTDADVADLRAALGDMQRADEIQAAVDADVRFHRLLVLATHNELLEHLEMLLFAGLRARNLVAMRARFDTDLPRHTAVVDAVEAGDPARAEAAMHALLEHSAEHAREAVRGARSVR
jgi:DNA-binding FadR family transcriptional regulator